MNELALFAGAGGGILGGHLLGWRTVCAVEWEPYPASVLAARQNDGILPPFPVWDDIRTFNGKPWRGIVDVVSGGFPCQDISAAGKGTGITGARSGLWGEMARVIHEVRPRFCFVENSPMLTSRGLGTVLGDLAAMGFDAKWGVLGAADIGANHQRDRIWIVGKATNSTSLRLHNEENQRVLESQRWGELQSEQSRDSSEMAHTNGMRQLQPQGSESDQRGRVGDSGEPLADADNKRFAQLDDAAKPNQTRQSSWCASSTWGGPDWWSVEPGVGRVADGVAARVDRLKALGNGQVPACAAAAWRLLINASQSGQTF